MKRHLSLLLAPTLACLLLLATGPVEARGKKDFGWPLAQVYGAAVRFVRIDRGCKITDRDPVAAYVAFECPGKRGKAATNGGIELIPIEKATRSVVRAQVTLANEPRSVEISFLDQLERKIRDERGSPPRRKRPPKKKPTPDGGS